MLSAGLRGITNGGSPASSAAPIVRTPTSNYQRLDHTVPFKYRRDLMAPTLATASTATPAGANTTPTTPAPPAKRAATLRRYLSVKNWDRFYQRVYSYYQGHGLVCILMTKVFNLLTAAFVIVLTTFAVACVDHRALSASTTLADALVPQCLSRLSTFHALSLLVFLCFWAYEALKFAFEWREVFEMRDVYVELLQVADDDLSTTEWHVIVSRLIHLHNDTVGHRPSMPRRLNALDIANRIMRRDNYLIAMFNKEVFDLSVPGPRWLLGGKQMLTKVIEWNLRFVLMNYVFDGSGGDAFNKEFLRDTHRNRFVAELRRRLLMMAAVNLLLMPFTVPFLLIYFFFKYAQEFHKNPTRLASRGYSPLARWKFRDFNELPHVFDARLARSYAQANEYMRRFPSHKLAVVGRFVAFISGSLAVCLTVLSILDDDFLLQLQITRGRSVLWYLGVFGLLWSAGRSLVPDDDHPPPAQADQLLMDVVTDIHYLPNEWRVTGLDSKQVHRDFSNLYEYRVVLFIQELLAVVFAPVLLALSLPPRAPRIIDFFREFTVHVDSVGHVCSFALFNFVSFDARRGRFQPTPEIYESSPGRPRQVTGSSSKMEQSMMNFRHHWEGDDGKDGDRARATQEKSWLASPVPVAADAVDTELRPMRQRSTSADRRSCPSPPNVDDGQHDDAQLSASASYNTALTPLL